MVRCRAAAAVLAFAAILIAGDPAPAGAQERDDRFFSLRDPFRPRGGDLFRSSPVIIDVPSRQARPLDAPTGEPQGIAYGSAAEADAQRQTPASEYIVVIGDALSDYLAQGLADAFVQDRPDVAVIKKGRANSTLLRGDQAFDWLVGAFDVLNTEKITIGVVMIGLNDRQPVRDDTGTHDPRSERWHEIYRRRVDDLINRFKQKNVPLYWVGLPAMRSARATQDMQALNEIIRERTARANVPFIDVWDGFVDEQGAFFNSGPALDGQTRRLRASDGVGFTRSGGRKLAHFAEREIAIFLNQKAPLMVPVPADEPSPSAGAPAAGPASAAAPAQRPVAGPVVPLVGVTGPGGALAGASNAQRSFSQDQTVMRVLLRGESPPAVSGRADDFAWTSPTATPQLPAPAAPAPASR